MLSRVLKDCHEEVRPLRARRHAASVPAADVAGSGAAEASATAEAEQLRARIAQVSANAEQQVRQAYDAGLRAGDAAARKQLESQVRSATERMAAAIAEVGATRAETIRRAEADTVRLALEIARRILHRELSVDASALEGLIKAALGKLQDQEVYKVRVHPNQENLLKSCLMQQGRGQSVTVVADPTQPEGGAVFDIGRGSLDASLETQLAEIERGLVDQLEARP